MTLPRLWALSQAREVEHNRTMRDVALAFNLAQAGEGQDIERAFPTTVAPKATGPRWWEVSDAR